MLPAKGNIGVVSSEQNLCPLSYNPFLIISGITFCRASAPADRLNLLNHIRPCQKPHTARKKLVFKICAQSIADNRNLKVVH